MLTSPKSTSPRRKCVSAECGQESKTGDGHGQSRGNPVDAPHPPTVPSQHSEHRHQHRSLFIHPVRAPSQTGEREGSGRTGKDGADQIVSVHRLLLHSPLKEDKKKGQKLLLSGERGQEEKVQRTTRLSLGTIGVNGTRGQDRGGGGVWWGVHYVKITLMPFRHWAPLLSNPTRAQPGPIQKPKE